MYESGGFYEYTFLVQPLVCSAKNESLNSQSILHRKPDSNQCYSIILQSNRRRIVVHHTGLEPVIFSVRGRRDNRYSNGAYGINDTISKFNCKVEDRGFEPLTTACKTVVLPLTLIPRVFSVFPLQLRIIVVFIRVPFEKVLAENNNEK